MEHRFRLDLTDKIDLKDPKKYIALGNLSIYYTWKNIKSEYNNNKFNISASTWNDTFNLPDGFYSVADIKDYFELIIKKQKTCKSTSSNLSKENNQKKLCFQNKNGIQIRMFDS